MACTKKTVKASGLHICLTRLREDPHRYGGLGSHEFYTWVKRMPSAGAHRPKRMRDRAAQFLQGKKTPDKGDDSLTEVMWIRDLLVPVFTDARIATYSYKSDWRDRDVKTSLRECANLFLNEMLHHRQQEHERQRPIILVGHSFGCVVIQQALVFAASSRHFHELGLSVAGIIFLGAPLQGSDVALWGTWLAQALQYDPTLLKVLQRNSQPLFDVARDFRDCRIEWDLVCFYETQDAKYGPLTIQTVSQQSATQLGKRMIPLNTDHSGLNKFSGEDDENFERLLPEIRRMVESGGSIVTERHRKNNTGADSHGNVHWNVPRPVNSLFTGRAKLLPRIQTVLRSDTTRRDKQKRFIITGLGGLGKSEICLQVANLMRDDFWGIFWVDVDKPSTAECDFIAVAKNFGSSVESVPEVLQVFVTTHRSWLLILDNADNPDFDYQVYFPPGNHGAVLMISRVAECKRYSPDAFEALEGLEEQGSKELLLKAAGLAPESWPSHNDQAKDVVDLLGSHTLALIQAGAYIRQDHCQLNQYPEKYRRQRKRLLNYGLKQAKSRYLNVYATFEASADVLEQSRRSGSESVGDALRLLEILSMLDSGVLPLQIFEAAWNGCKEISQASSDEARDIDKLTQSHVSNLPGFVVPEDDEWDSFRLKEATSLLVSLSLATRHNLKSDLGLSMHLLTYAWAKDRYDLERQGKSWIATGCILVFSRSNTRLWQTQERRLLPHILSYLDIKVNKAFGLVSKAAVTSLFLKCGWAILDMRQDSRLSQLLQDIFLELGRNAGEPSKEFLALYDLQARSLINLGRSKEAVALLEQVVKIEETMLPETHPSRLASQHALAGVYAANGQVVEAVALLEHVVMIKRSKLPVSHPSRIVSENALSCLLILL